MRFLCHLLWIFHGDFRWYLAMFSVIWENFALIVYEMDDGVSWWIGNMSAHFIKNILQTCLVHFNPWSTARHYGYITNYVLWSTKCDLKWLTAKKYVVENTGTYWWLSNIPICTWCICDWHLNDGWSFFFICSMECRIFMFRVYLLCSVIACGFHIYIYIYQLKLTRNL